jgi:ribosomal protein L37E
MSKSTCDRCGVFSVYDVRCKLVCMNCGLVRDCTDP